MLSHQIHYMRRISLALTALLLLTSLTGLVNNELDEKMVFRTSEDTQWASGYECPLDNEDDCDALIAMGTEHNNLLDMFRNGSVYWTFAAPNAGAALTNLDADIVKVKNENPSVWEDYLQIREHQKAKLEYFYTNNNLEEMTIFDIQKENALIGAEFREPGVENPLQDEVLGLFNSCIELVRGANASDDIADSMAACVDRSVEGNDFETASEGAQCLLSQVHVVYHASDWYWDDATMDRGQGFWKKVGDFFGVIGGVALEIITAGDGGCGGTGNTIVEASLDSFKSNPAPGSSSGGFNNDFTCPNMDLDTCLDDIMWAGDYVCPVLEGDSEALDSFCEISINSGILHNEILDLLRTTGDTWPYGSPDSDGALNSLDATIFKASTSDIDSFAKIVTLINAVDVENDESLAGSPAPKPALIEWLIDWWNKHRSHQSAMLDDFYANNDVSKMSEFEVQQASALHSAEYMPRNSENELHLELLTLTENIRNLVRNATSENSDIETMFEEELHNIFSDRTFDSASSQAQCSLTIMHGIYHASDSYWDESTTTRGQGFWKKVGDFFGVVAGVALEVITAPDGGCGGAGNAIVSASIESFKNSAPETGGSSSGEVFGPMSCSDAYWDVCAGVNIATLRSDINPPSPIATMVAMPQGWVVANWGSPDHEDPTNLTEKDSFIVFGGENGIGIYYFPDLSCDEAEALNSIPGHSWHACFDVPGWGAVVFVAAPELEPDAPVDISTPDGDVVMTVQEMKDAGYISEAQISVENGALTFPTKPDFSSEDGLDNDCDATIEDDCEKSSNEKDSEENSVPGFTSMIAIIGMLGAFMFASRSSKFRRNDG